MGLTGSNGKPRLDNWETAFLAKYACRLRHISKQELWHVYDGAKWVSDDNDCRTWDAIKCICDKFGISPKDRKNDQIRSVAERIAKIEGVRARAEEFDRSPLLLNTQGAVVSLEGGEMEPNKPEYMMTKVAGVSPVQGDTPEWDKFLDFVTNGDEELREYLLRLFGYWLSGDTRVQKLWFLTGRGRNGKSTLLALLRYLWGDYAVNAPPGLLVYREHERHPTDMASLWGCRLAILSEMNPDDRLDVAKMKYMTGEEKITARFMRGDFFEFDRYFKLVCACNDLPRIEGGGGLAERRRIVVIPFKRVVPESDVIPDLLERLKAEGPAILHQIIQAGVRYFRDGLSEPAVVVEETASYWEQNDNVPQFIAESCVMDNEARTSIESLYSAYGTWAFEGRIPKDEVLTKRAFNKAIETAGIQKYRGTGGTWTWRGIREADESEKSAIKLDRVSREDE